MQYQAIDGKIKQKIIHWQSDYSIVSGKSMKMDGEKGIAGMQRDVRDTSATLRGGIQMSTKLTSLTQRARENRKRKFTSLMHIMTEDFLKSCFRELKRDKATGIDGVSVEDYEVKLEENIKDLVERLKAKRYRPQPVRRVYIPKADGSKRGLGIPATEDKIVQMGIKKILIINREFEKMVVGLQGPEETLDNIARDVNKLLKVSNVRLVK